MGQSLSALRREWWICSRWLRLSGYRNQELIYTYCSISTARCACKLIITYMHMYSESRIHVTLSHYMCIRERDSHSICTQCALIRDHNPAMHFCDFVCGSVTTCTCKLFHCNISYCGYTSLMYTPLQGYM